MRARTPRAAVIPVPGPLRVIPVVQPASEAGKAFLAENTRRAYFRDWKDFFGVEDLRQVTPAMVFAVKPDDVADFRDRLIASGLAPGTVNRKLTSVRAFFDQMVLRRQIAVNPAHPKLVRAPKRGQVKKMDYLSSDELVRIFSVIDRSTPMGRRDYALIMTGIHMGLRRSEVLAMRTENVKKAGDRAYYLFRSKGEKERKVVINRDLESALAAYTRDRDADAGWLFPGRDPLKPLSGDQFRRIVIKYIDACGIAKKIGTHGLRATFITVNIDKGTPLSEIQKTVGHSRGDTTLGYARDLEMIKSRAPMAMEGFSAAPNRRQPGLRGRLADLDDSDFREFIRRLGWLAFKAVPAAAFARHKRPFDTIEDYLHIMPDDALPLASAKEYIRDLLSKKTTRELSLKWFGTDNVELAGEVAKGLSDKL